MKTSDVQMSTVGEKESAKVSIRTRDRWRFAAYMVTSIIDGLSEHWEWKADLVSHTLAGTNPRNPSGSDVLMLL